MDGEEKLFWMIVCVTVICVTILYSFLFIALWDYRQWVGLSLLAVIIAGAVVFLRGKITEQDLRTTHFRHYDETPLDAKGEPMHWHQDYQANPHRH